MHKLIKGIVDYRENIRPAYLETFARLALGQSPDTLLICCSDSRVVPNLFASTDPGDVFVMRNVGNLVPPCDPADSDAAAGAAVDYAVDQLKVKDIVVCGHSECGANIAITQDCVGLSGHIKSWLRHGSKAHRSLLAGHTLDPKLKFHNQLSQLNVVQQMEHLRSYPNVQKALEEGRITIHGWWFDLAEAEVLAYEEGRGGFVVIDQDEARLIMERSTH